MSHITEGPDDYFGMLNISNVMFDKSPTFKFKFTANHFIIVVDSDVNSISFSFNGEDVGGVLYPKDKSITFDFKRINRIWLKVNTNTPSSTPVRFWAWV